MIARLRREFNVSVAELDLQDAHQEALIGCAMIAGEAAFLQSALETVRRWVAANWSDGDVIAQRLELHG